MISSSQYRTKATISIIYLILFFFLGVYTLFTKADQVSIKKSTEITGNSQNALSVSQPTLLNSRLAR